MLKVSTKSARRSWSPRCKTASIQTRRKAVENPFPARAGMNSSQLQLLPQRQTRVVN